MKYIILLFVALAALWFYQFKNGQSRDLVINKKDFSKPQIVLIESLESNPTSQDAQKINAVLLQDLEPEVRQFLVRLISLNLLATDGSAFRRFKNNFEKLHPDEGYFNFLEEDFPVLCSVCSGVGGEACPKCKGEGKCTNIKCENGRIRYESFDKKIEDKECFICKGKGICQGCMGTKFSQNSCKNCGGSGRKGSKDIAQKLYKETLQNFKK